MWSRLIIDPPDFPKTGCSPDFTVKRSADRRQGTAWDPFWDHTSCTRTDNSHVEDVNERPQTPTELHQRVPPTSWGQVLRTAAKYSDASHRTRPDKTFSCRSTSYQALFDRVALSSGRSSQVGARDPGRDARTAHSQLAPLVGARVAIVV